MAAEWKKCRGECILNERGLQRQRTRKRYSTGQAFPRSHHQHLEGASSHSHTPGDAKADDDAKDAALPYRGASETAERTIIRPLPFLNSGHHESTYESCVRDLAEAAFV